METSAEATDQAMEDRPYSSGETMRLTGLPDPEEKGRANQYQRSHNKRQDEYRSPFKTVEQRFPYILRKEGAELCPVGQQDQEENEDDRYNEAITAYKKVISTYPGSEEARMAQRDLKSVYIDLNKVDDYVAYASTIPGGANFDINERDS